MICLCHQNAISLIAENCLAHCRISEPRTAPGASLASRNSRWGGGGETNSFCPPSPSPYLPKTTGKGKSPMSKRAAKTRFGKMAGAGNPEGTRSGQALACHNCSIPRCKRGWAGVTDPPGAGAWGIPRCLSLSIKKSDHCFVSAATQGK